MIYFFALLLLTAAGSAALRGRPPFEVARIASTTEGSYRALYEMGFFPALSSLLCAALEVMPNVSAISSIVSPFMG